MIEKVMHGSMGRRWPGIGAMVERSTRRGGNARKLLARLWLSSSIQCLTLHTTSKYDGHQLRQLVKKDETIGIEARVYTGDKGYDDGDNHEMLLSRGMSSALCLKDYRTRLYPEGLWADMKGSADYRDGMGQRYKVEQKNASGMD